MRSVKRCETCRPSKNRSRSRLDRDTIFDANPILKLIALEASDGRFIIA